MNIREPELADIPVWSKMRKELWPDSEDMNASELHAYCLGESIDIKQAFIAEVEAKVIGFIELNIRNYAEGSRKTEVPYIEAWYVHPEFHGKGYGKQLIQKAENWVLNNGFTELASDTQVANKRSISVHKHLGFTETDRIVCFLKQLN
jgi:aminoglycoside 6'-N-acetyltransferase I